MGAIAIYQIPSLPKDPIYARHIGSTINKLLFGIPFIYITIRNLKNYSPESDKIIDNSENKKLNLES